MDLLVKYIGNDLNYWSKLKARFISNYSDLPLSFLEESVNDSFNARTSFVNTYNEKPQIIYIDFSVNPKELLYLVKMLNQNNEMREVSVVGLFDYQAGWNLLQKSMLASMRLLHFKSSEIHNVVYDPISLLDVELAKDPGFVIGKEIDDLVLEQLMRVSYIEDDLYHIETNSFLKEGSIIELDRHPLSRFTSSKRFYIKNFSTKNLYYNTRYSYDLEFTYEDSTFFKATEENWITYKKYRNNPIGYNKDTGKDYDVLASDVKKRKSRIRPMREGIRSWLAETTRSVIPKKLKVLVIDKSFEIFKELDNDSEQFPYSLNIQTELTRNYYQIERTMPLLIVIRFDDVNNKDVLSKIIDKIKNLDEYNPYIVLFDYKGVGINLKEELDYENILTYPNNIDIKTIKDLGKSLDDKYEMTKSKSRVYLKASNELTIITVLRKMKILAMTESVLFLESDIDIPMWTVFKARSPVEMLLTIVPHKDNSKFKNNQKCYRCLINGVGEKEKAMIRSLINKSFDVVAN
jgi:hypothetical protein